MQWSSTACVIVVILVDFIRLQNLEEIGRACRILSVKLTWRGIENGVEDLLASFYGAYPEDDTNWRHNLWAGKFFPILAFYGIYQMDEIDWTVPYLDQNAIIHLQVSS